MHADFSWKSILGLDEFGYELLRYKVEIQNRMENKVRNFFSATNPVVFRFKTAHKVKSINGLLDEIKNDATSFGLKLGPIGKEYLWK